MRYRCLGRSGLRISELTLGTMTFGTAWGWGTDEAGARAQLEAYRAAGGNSLDTAINYTNGESEQILGKILGTERDALILGTKYTLNTRPGDPNAGGNARKNMMQAVRQSLKALNTDYIDLYWVHAYDFVTPVEEVMRALDDLVRAGTIRYAAVSDYPAWKVAEANTLAKWRDWSPFVALQIEYNLTKRDGERDLIPMAEDLGIGVMPWSPLASGVLSGKYSRADLNGAQSERGGLTTTDGTRRAFAANRLNERVLSIADKVKEIAAAIGKSPSQVALRWLLQKQGVASVILGARTTEQLQDNLGCLDFSLSAEQMTSLDEGSAIELGFPHDFIRGPMVKQLVFGGVEVEAPR